MGKYCNHNITDENNTLITTYGMGKKTPIKVEDDVPVISPKPKITLKCKFCIWEGVA